MGDVGASFETGRLKSGENGTGGEPPDT